MKPLILIATVICSSAFAAEPVTTVTSASESKATQPAANSFCGQDVIQRLFLKTEIGKQLQLRQQEASRQALLQAMKEGKISVQEYMQSIAEDEVPEPSLPLAPPASKETTPK